ncbi:MAG: type II toxin-antitoxin system HicB family antitoxin [Clostridiales Family XIII bacterium]|jgi:predicted RNase H-like HicB family nuclease|nr:type II toxin-antitoxin system HicB family antitoxin [Clostridiales Family XIII bacterium]
MKYAYPAIFTEEEGKILVEVPDLPHTFTFGDDIADAIFMAQDAIAMWLWDAENENGEIPKPSTKESILEKIDSSTQFVNIVACDTDEYRKQVSTKSVIKSVSIPEWLDYRAKQVNAPLSFILQEGLKSHLGIHD